MKILFPNKFENKMFVYITSSIRIEKELLTTLVKAFTFILKSNSILINTRNTPSEYKFINEYIFNIYY